MNISRLNNLLAMVKPKANEPILDDTIIIKSKDTKHIEALDSTSPIPKVNQSGVTV